MTKTVEQSFRDWEATVFGFGYGTGEQHTLAALKNFLKAVGRDDLPDSYDYQKLEAVCGPQVTWLLINILARHLTNIIEYGTSPRYGWLTEQGIALKKFVDSRTITELEKICCEHDENYIHCYPDACNCGPNGYEKSRKCENPFWVCR